MSKFLPIGTKGELLNSDMIARIIPKEDGGWPGPAPPPSAGA